MPDWADIFRLQLPVVETMARATITYLALYGILRVAGKRESGALTLNDLLVVVLVAQATSSGLVGDEAGIPDSLLAVLTILFWSFVIDALAYRFRRLRVLLKSAPALIVSDGRLHRRALRRELMQDDEVMSQLRLHGITDLQQVERAYLEVNGMISVVRRDGHEVEAVEKPPTIG